MNFLAHLHLADGDAGDMTGGIAADFVRHPDLAALAPDVLRGVMLHRAVDGFTDRNPITLRSISRISREFGWFSGIVIDIYYDHILARDWRTYSAESLRAFATRSYAVLEDRHVALPGHARDFIRTFIDQDRLNLYATREGIQDTLARVSRVIAERIPNRAMWLPDAMPLLIARDADLAADFHAFYPELMAFAAGQKAR
ncbi:acyl carrier protein phosphodiesterase [Gemmata sp. JC717]|uniref:acyl carrier protein phosphodiesterase n=1 Tax=Gemmata algarum TaxID=2975278 RepID=UPI0021BADE78|nr:acyl carrier protein phosphodiesterase [Gemmata algarum]MDY3555366.1 acyl carrier protein phosphodiesterase [Gemmata algarum]